MKHVGEDCNLFLGNRLKAKKLKQLPSKSFAGMTVMIILSAGIRKTINIWNYFSHKSAAIQESKSFNVQDYGR